jgi:hypothetical protein
MGFAALRGAFDKPLIYNIKKWKSGLVTAAVRGGICPESVR